MSDFNLFGVITRIKNNKNKNMWEKFGEQVVESAWRFVVAAAGAFAGKCTYDGLVYIYESVSKKWRKRRNKEDCNNFTYNPNNQQAA